MPTIVFYLVIAGFVAGAFGGTYLKGRSDGNNACETKYAQAIIDAEAKAAIEIEKIRNQSAKRIKELENVPVSEEESVIAPVLHNVLDGMRDRHS